MLILSKKLKVKSKKYQPAPKSQKGRLDTKAPRHQILYDNVYQQFKIDEFSVLVDWCQILSFQSELKFKVQSKEIGILIT